MGGVASLSTTGCFLLSLDGYAGPADAAAHQKVDAATEGSAGSKPDGGGTGSNPDAYAVLATTGLTNPTQLLVDDGGLYTVDPGAAMVFRIDKQDGAVTPLVSSTLHVPTALAQDATHIYFADQGDQNADGRGIYRIGKSGTTATLLAEPPAFVGVNALTVSPTSVYWTENHSHHVSRASINGGTYVSIYATDPSGDYSTMGSGPVGIAVDQTTLYWTDGHSANQGGAVQSLELASGAVTTLASSLGYPSFLAIDEQSTYWVESGDNAIKSQPKTGGALTTLATGQKVGGGFIAVDATYVYWANELTGEVVRVDKMGAAHPTTLAANQNQPTGIAVDDVAVYWTNSLDGTVGRVLKSR